MVGLNNKTAQKAVVCLIVGLSVCWSRPAAGHLFPGGRSCCAGMAQAQSAMHGDVPAAHCAAMSDAASSQAASSETAASGATAFADDGQCMKKLCSSNGAPNPVWQTLFSPGMPVPLRSFFLPAPHGDDDMFPSLHTSPFFRPPISRPANAA
jgi:hypothetical protein